MESFEVGAALGAGAYDQERTVGSEGELAGGEQRERGGAPGRDDAAVQYPQPPPRPGLHHHDLALYCRQAAARVLRVDRNQLGHSDFLA